MARTVERGVSTVTDSSFRPAPGRAVAPWRPGDESPAPDEERLGAIRSRDEHAVRKRGQIRGVGDGPAVGGEPVAVELPVERADERVAREPAVRVSEEPRGAEAAEVRPAAFPARAMAGRQRRRLVEEEELRVAIRLP